VSDNDTKHAGTTTQPAADSPPDAVPAPDTGPDADSIHHLEQQRRENRDAVRALGADPYGQRTGDLVALAEARGRYDEAADAANQQSVAARKQATRDGAADDDLPAVVDERPRVADRGRVVLHRDNGKLVWINLRDDTTSRSRSR
jgi:lysyl-tRNA synthetase class II